MLLEYLQENYNVNEPIFVSDIDLPVTANNLRQMFKALCDKGDIIRYDTGIYYLKGKSKLKGGINILDYIQIKFIKIYMKRGYIMLLHNDKELFREVITCHL